MQPCVGGMTLEHTTSPRSSLDEAGKRIKGKRSVAEMEQDFLAAMAAWYFEGECGDRICTAALLVLLLHDALRFAPLQATQMTVAAPVSHHGERVLGNVVQASQP